jgi:hypothetical protein
LLRWPRKQGYRNLMLMLERQAAFVEEAPEIFLPIAGAWKLHIDKNAKTTRKRPHVARSGVVAHNKCGSDDDESNKSAKH